MRSRLPLPRCLARSSSFSADVTFLTRQGFCNPDDTVIPHNEGANLAQLKAAALDALDAVNILLRRKP